MSKAAKATRKSKEKNSLRKKVAELLNSSFPDIKASLGEKSFNKKVKKASKLLTNGVGKKKAKVKAEPKAKVKTKKEKTPAPVKAVS